MIDPYRVAVEGIGFDSLSIATLGFVGFEVEVIVFPGSGIMPEGYEERPRGHLVIIRVRFGAVMIERKYRIWPVVAKVLAKLLSHRRVASRSIIRVGAKPL